MSKKKNLHIVEICASASGGVRTHLADCARILTYSGHKVVVAAPPSVLHGADYGSAHLQNISISSRPSFTDLFTLSKLRKIISKADVVHAHGLRAGAFASLALGKAKRNTKKLIVTEHNSPVGGVVTRAVGKSLLHIIAARVDALLAVSPDLAMQAKKMGISSVEIAVVPAPPPSSVAGADDFSAVWAGNKVRLLTVARLAPQKGLDLLLTSAALVREQLAELNPESVNNFIWVVAGEGPMRQQLAARIAAQNLPVYLLGRCNNVSALMKSADMVVQTSLWEGQPLAVQEALQVGAAVVATDVGGTAWTARGGATLVPPEPARIAQAVLHLLANPLELAQARQQSCASGQLLPTQTDLLQQLERIFNFC